MRDMTLRVAGASRSQNFKNNSFSSIAFAPVSFDLLALELLAVQVHFDFGHLALIVSNELDLRIDVGHEERAVILRLEFFLAAAIARLTEQFVAFVRDDQSAHGSKVVFSNEVVVSLRVHFSWLGRGL